ncbi:DUF3429 domain-containing protein [Methylolobus aquaticus]
MNTRPINPTPPVPFWLGTAAMLPFVVLTSGLYALPSEYRNNLVFWLSSYGAVVLSFVGAIHWGLALVHPKMLYGDRMTSMGWSVVPAAAAWSSFLVPAESGLLLMAGSFAAQYGADQQFESRFSVPEWYPPLRTSLTTVAALCLILAVARLRLS